MRQAFLVWVDDWQVQCCGEPFAVGDEVDWTLSDQPERDWLVPVLGAELAAALTHVEDHHATLPNAHSGFTSEVTRIRAFSSRYAADPRYPGENAIAPVAGTAEVEELQHADGGYRAAKGLRFVGFLVDLAVQ